MLRAKERPRNVRLYASDRRIEIWAVLIMEEQTTLNKLAEMFSVSKNTILADMDFLTMIHEIDVTTGRNGGYRLIISDRKNLSFLYAKHVKLLLRLADGLSEVEHQMIREVIDVLMNYRKP